MKTIRAIYENGVFRPLEPVDLPEQAAVMVEPAEDVRVKTMTMKDLMVFHGTVKGWPEDPVAWQRKQRDEEWL